jgi:transposase
MSDSPLIQVIEPRIPRHVVCPYCEQRQPFRKKKEHWRTVKAPHLKLFQATHYLKEPI